MSRKRYLIDAEHGLILLPDVPSLDWEHWVHGVSAAFSDPRFRDGMNFLSDRRHTLVPYTRMTMERVIRFFVSHPAQLAGSSWATVTVRKPVSDMIETIATLIPPGGVRVRNFSDIEPALDWLAPNARPEQRDTYLTWLERHART